MMEEEEQEEVVEEEGRGPWAQQRQTAAVVQRADVDLSSSLAIDGDADEGLHYAFHPNGVFPGNSK